MKSYISRKLPLETRRTAQILALRSIVRSQSLARLLLLWNLQAFATQDTLNRFFAHARDRPLRYRRDSAISATPILANQLDCRLCKCAFIITRCRFAPLCA